MSQFDANNRSCGTAARPRMDSLCGGAAGVALLDCLIYTALLSLLFGLGLSAFLQTLRHANELDRASVNLIRALQVGEQWRADVRRAVRPLLPLDAGITNELQILTPSGLVSYAFREGIIWRRAGAEATAPWLAVATGIRASRFLRDPRAHVVAWRWDLELAPRKDGHGERRVLSFQVVEPAAVSAVLQP